ncbi:MAG: nitroreductase family deazaflavin-dependent oxidoreductase, partial [Pseudomonadota bacterium]|nr:nitroreductase family deazaflavin-dependent oxidoreductase [Pseudomonadota bacterium]
MPDWVAEHVERYLATDGDEGHTWRGVPTLLLTTTGRKSGERRLIPLIYGEDDGAYIVVGSKGGHAFHPSWYENLVAHEDVEVQVKADRFSARASTAIGEERRRLWALMTNIW